MEDGQCDTIFFFKLFNIHHFGDSNFKEDNEYY